MVPDDTGRLFDEADDAQAPSRRAASAAVEPGAAAADAPLAERMRPRRLEEFLGQRHLLGPGRLVRRILESGEMASLILWGPPGSGKTTLARLLADRIDADFVALSAVLSGVRDVRRLAEEAMKRHRYGYRTILFIDEIHRFNKAQQDAFLPFVESGDLWLVGATTENPSFELVSPLLSRCKVVRLEPLDADTLVELARRALDTPPPRGFGDRQLNMDDELIEAIARFADGDARVALNTLELAVAMARAETHSGTETHPDTETLAAVEAPGGAETSAAAPVQVEERHVTEAMQRRVLRHDRAGEEHFNLISAFHKSVRSSDADAALYWLARMLEAGEDPKYVARRLLRMASEDIGLADPTALPLAVAAMRAVEVVGMPECALALAEVAVYLAVAAKSDALYRGYEAARRDVGEHGQLAVPLQLRNAPTRLMREMGYGRDYEHAHDLPDAATAMACLPQELRGRRYYLPTDRGREVELDEALRRIDELRRRLQDDEGAV